MVWAYRLKNVRIYNGRIKKNQNIRMYHLDFDLREHVYDLRNWSAKSTSPMFWL